MRTLLLSVASLIIIGLSPLYAQTISGTLNENTTLDAASSPWRVTGDVLVKNGITLTIEPGCTLYFDNRAGIEINTGGRIVAVGDPHNRIIMTRRDGTSDKWDGIEFTGTGESNLLGYIDMLYGDAGSHIIDVDHSKVVLDNITWNTDDRTVVEATHASLIIQHCTFPGVGEVEVVHGNYLADDEYLILIGNTFGKPLGYNDVIDFTDCKKPGPILEAYNNIFLGGGDDGLDLDGTDAHIEGNIFMGFHKDHDGSSTSNAIATGLRNGKTSDIVVARNIFYDNDHAVLLKEDCFMLAENNTFVNCDSAVINFSEWPYRTVDPGKGAQLVGNIFWNNRAIFENQFSQEGKPDPDISVDYCLVDTAYFSFGNNNISADPMFVNPESDFHLRPSSPAIGAGPNGLDMGAFVPKGVSITGEPADSTLETSARLHVGGPGITDYRFAVNDPNGGWSEVRSLMENPDIQLLDLIPGQSYRVYVQGKTFAGHWKPESEYGISKSWKVINPPSGFESAQSLAPIEYRLYENFPNPFNPSTSIRFDLPKQAHVLIEIFNALGQKKLILADKDFVAGAHQISLNSKGLSSGVYYYQLTTDEFKETKRMLLVR